MLCTSLRDPLRLFAPRRRVEFEAFLTQISDFASDQTVAAIVHRFEESIAGRQYLIEVSAVSKDRWRACIVRVPGVPTALMPFYGTTPDEAAKQLSGWLVRAHGNQPAATPRPR